MMNLQIYGLLDLKKDKNFKIRNFFIITFLILYMKSNFKPKKSTSDKPKKSKKTDEMTEEEFEEFVSKSGAAGTFMIFRSTKKEDEMGIDEL